MHECRWSLALTRIAHKIITAMFSYRFFIFLFVATICCCEASYTITVPPRDEECFYVNPVADSTLFGQFELLDDDLSGHPLSVIVTNVDGSKMKHRSKRGSREGAFKVDAPAKGKMYVCVQNGLVTGDGGKTRESKGRSKSDDRARRVGIHIDLETRNIHNEIHHVHSEVLHKAIGLHREIERLKNHHDHMRTRESSHRQVTEYTFSKLMAWVLAQCAAVIVMAVGQVLYLRRFLEKPRFM